MFKHKLIIPLLLIFFNSFGQKTERWDSSKIYNEIEKLNFLGSVLYIAAHPDDENTNLISHLSNTYKAKTGYLSLTRGDGGQNLIGTEFREALGVIRTQELLEARKIDGGQQFFTRANDFGYSKSPEETLKIWDKNQVLYDMTYIIRSFQPDIIITRFDHRTPGTTHGHHTTSAQLMQQVYENAAKINYFPNQLQNLKVWQPKRLFFNSSSFFYKSNKDFEKDIKSKFITIKTGNFYPNLGVSNSEIAAWARSKHRSQGFGTLTKRGDFNEYLEFINGKELENSENIFDGIDTSWNRLKNGEEIQEKIKLILKEFNFNKPENSVSKLVNLYKNIENLENSVWKTTKLADLQNIIFKCIGFHYEFSTDINQAVKNQSITIYSELIAQNFDNVKISDITYQPKKLNLKNKINLDKNIGFKDVFKVTIPKNAKYTAAQWINKNATNGMYFLEEDSWLLNPDIIREQIISFNVEILGKKFRVSSPIFYKTNDLSVGEICQPFDIVPNVSIKFSETNYIGKNLESKKIKLIVTNYKANNTINTKLTSDKNWEIEPKNYSHTFKNPNEVKEFEFTITPKSAQTSELKAFVTSDFETLNYNLQTISYDHIYTQRILKEAKVDFSSIDLKNSAKKIAYIIGAGDEVWKGLQQIGYEVSVLNIDTINEFTLANYDVVVLGIRSYNVLNSIKNKNDYFLNFVKNGGTLISQYNTTQGLLHNDFAPYKLKLSSNRVTDENAKVTFLNPKHSVLNYPNKITDLDFTNWVQEQGLYYPEDWDRNFTPILESKDPDSQKYKGALLIAKYGKGNYIYTGLSFFRQIPAGVIGAYRLLTNLIEIESEDEQP